MKQQQHKKLILSNEKTKTKNYVDQCPYFEANTLFFFALFLLIIIFVNMTIVWTGTKHTSQDKIQEYNLANEYGPC